MYFKSKKILVSLMVLAMVFFAMHGGAFANQEAENIIAFNIGCGIPLEMPAEYAETLVHTQKTHFAPVTEVFSIRIGEDEHPLYRIDFGNESIGELLGVMQMDNGDVPVTYTVYPFSKQEIEALDEETLTSYYSTMESFNFVIEAICADPRFTYAPTEGIGEIRELQLEYWMLTLPENIYCTETKDDDIYSAAFYGRICGEEIALYTIHIGIETNAIGSYNLNGTYKPLSVEIFEVSENVFWSEEDYDTAYKMLDTINDVMNVILSSEDFKE